MFTRTTLPKAAAQRRAAILNIGRGLQVSAPAFFLPRWSHNRCGKLQAKPLPITSLRCPVSCDACGPTMSKVRSTLDWASGGITRARVTRARGK